MDRKTLEYMEERAKKAREIVNTIEKLLKNIDCITNVKQVDFVGYSHRVEFGASVGDLTKLVKAAYVKVSTEKIQSLEQELAEL